MLGPSVESIGSSCGGVVRPLDMRCEQRARQGSDEESITSDHRRFNHVKATLVSDAVLV